MTKICSKCKEVKPLSEFSLNGGCLYGVHSICKQCIRGKWNLNRHPVEQLPENHKRCSKCKEIKTVNDFYKKGSVCRGCSSLDCKNNYQSNKEMYRQRQRIWDDKNKERLLQSKNEYSKNKYQTDLNYKIKMNIRGRIHKAFSAFSSTGKVWTSKEYGIDYFQICKHLTASKPIDFDTVKYHIDHIVPCSAFNHNNPKEIYYCHHWMNLQWLPASVNLSKNDKYNPKHKDELIRLVDWWEE